MYREFRLEDWAERTPDKEVLFDGEERLSYKQLKERADWWSERLAREGLEQGDCILSLLPNCNDAVALLYGAMKKGIVVCPSNTQGREKELREILDFLNPGLILFSEEIQGEIIRHLRNDIKMLSIEHGRITELSEKDSQKKSRGEENRDNSFLMVRTSGTTGVPKVVELTLRNLLVAAGDISARFHQSPEDVTYIPVPLCHLFGIMGVIVSILSGGRIILSGRFEAEQALRLIEQERVTVQYCVPTMYGREIDAYVAAERKPDLSSLRTGMIAGAVGTKKYFSWFEDHAGCRLLNSYGMTEANGLLISELEDEKEIRYTKTGKPGDHVEIKILTPEGEEADRGVQGEITVRSEVVMKGYYRNPEEMKRAFTPEGWFLTGDYGIMDEEGYVTVTGRKKDLIIRGGYNVFPAEVEEVYLAHPDVESVCVKGYADEGLGERICAFVVLYEGRVQTEEELREYGKVHMARYKVPDKIVFLEEMPLLPNGKTDRKALCAE